MSWIGSLAQINRIIRLSDPAPLVGPCTPPMGTLLASIYYERENKRMPPLDPQVLSELSQRRLGSYERVLHSRVDQIDEGKHLAEAWAAKSNAEVEALRQIGLQRQDTVREARNMLIASASAPSLTAGTKHSSRTKVAGTTKGPRYDSRSLGGSVEVTSQRIQEAMRETARDSLRREQIMNLRKDAFRKEVIARIQARVHMYPSRPRLTLASCAASPRMFSTLTPMIHIITLARFASSHVCRVPPHRSWPLCEIVPSSLSVTRSDASMKTSAGRRRTT